MNALPPLGDSRISPEFFEVYLKVENIVGYNIKNLNPKVKSPTKEKGAGFARPHQFSFHKHHLLDGYEITSLESVDVNPASNIFAIIIFTVPLHPV